MYTIRKDFAFSASHSLDCLPADHPCSRIHGHNYVVTVELRAEATDEVGMVFDYRRLEPVKKFIDSTLDHKHLNDFLPLNPTAENLAVHIFELFKESIPYLHAVEVSETPKTSARYEQADTDFISIKTKEESNDSKTSHSGIPYFTQE